MVQIEMDFISTSSENELGPKLVKYIRNLYLHHFHDAEIKKYLTFFLFDIPQYLKYVCMMSQLWKCHLFTDKNK